MGNDAVSDMLTRIRNASLAGSSRFVLVPVTKINIDIARILLEEGFINRCQACSAVAPWFFVIHLKVKSKKPSLRVQPFINSIIRVSTPGRRVYCKVRNLWTLRGLSKKSCVIMSTSKGVMTSEKALKENVGGEVLCCIW